jgi:hypothetical protein
VGGSDTCLRQVYHVHVSSYVDAGSSSCARVHADMGAGGDGRDVHCAAAMCAVAVVQVFMLTLVLVLVGEAEMCIVQLTCSACVRKVQTSGAPRASQNSCTNPSMGTSPGSKNQPSKNLKKESATSFGSRTTTTYLVVVVVVVVAAVVVVTG